MAKETKEEIQKTLNDIKYRMEEMQEKLYKNNIESRPTIMQKIIDREKELFNHIKYCIKECEKETGREFDLTQSYLAQNRKTAMLVMYPDSDASIIERLKNQQR